MDSECTLNDDYNACYYVTPAYSKSAPPSHNNNSCSSSSSSSSSSSGSNGSCGSGCGSCNGSSPDDHSRLVALIEEFNTNNHGLIMTAVCTPVHCSLFTLTEKYAGHFRLSGFNPSPLVVVNALVRCVCCGGSIRGPRGYSPP